MAEIVHQNVTAMTAPCWRTYLRDVVHVAPAFPAVDEFIAATAFNLPDTIKLIDEKAQLNAGLSFTVFLSSIFFAHFSHYVILASLGYT